MHILITGGCGFIGSALIRHIIRKTSCSVVNLDKLTYAAIFTQSVGETVPVTLSEPYNSCGRLGYPSASAVRGLSSLHPERQPCASSIHLSHRIVNCRAARSVPFAPLMTPAYGLACPTSYQAAAALSLVVRVSVFSIFSTFSSTGLHPHGIT